MVDSAEGGIEGRATVGMYDTPSFQNQIKLQSGKASGNNGFS